MTTILFLAVQRRKQDRHALLQPTLNSPAPPGQRRAWDPISTVRYPLLASPPASVITWSRCRNILAGIGSCRLVLQRQHERTP